MADKRLELRTTRLFEEALKAEGVTGQAAQLARSIYSQESSAGRNTRTSNAGARGGMQIIPRTFNSVADKGWSIDNPEHNARAGIRYIKSLVDRADGDPALAAVGYYSGPGGMDAAKRGVAYRDKKNPNAPNTFQYANQVVARMGLDPLEAGIGIAPNEQNKTSIIPGLVEDDSQSEAASRVNARKAARKAAKTEAKVDPMAGLTQNMSNIQAPTVEKAPDPLQIAGTIQANAVQGSVGVSDITQKIGTETQNFDSRLFKRV